MYQFPTNTLNSAQTSDFQNYEIINTYCLRPLSSKCWWGCIHNPFSCFLASRGCPHSLAVSTLPPSKAAMASQVIVIPLCQATSHRYTFWRLGQGHLCRAVILTTTGN